MDNRLQLLPLMANREKFYRFLACIYRIEVDQQLLEQMKEMTFPSPCSDEKLNEGYELLANYLHHCDGHALTELAVDYAKVFLGAGSHEAAAAFPYASVYTSKKRIMMQEARDQAVDIYASKGLCANNETVDFPEDHLALLFEYMAILCHETINALNQEKDVSASLKEQLDFLQDNLQSWTPAFCADIERYAETGFYKGIGKITDSYLVMDRSILDSLLN